MTNPSYKSKKSFTATSTSPAKDAADSKPGDIRPAFPPPPPRGELRRLFLEHLTLQQKAPRTIETYTSWIYDLAAFHHRSPDQLGHAEIRAWILHLITERKLSASSVNLAINALRSFYGFFRNLRGDFH